MSIVSSIKHAFKPVITIPVLRSENRELPIVLRAIELSDEEEWYSLRDKNDSWLAPWQAQDPCGGEGFSFSAWVHNLRVNERQGTGVVFVIVLHERIIGQISISNILYASMRSGLVGYWIDSRYAGRGIMPLALAMLANWALQKGNGSPSLHRLEIAIIPRNIRSQSVVKKIGAHNEGVRKQYIYVNNCWEDHEIYVLFEQDVHRCIAQFLCDTM
ncbi:MAG: GNAT family protein [Bifidobacteriaceae bacterium]|nr:GNAT family protein [Bifidobacteriaceae bacterium]